jgi:D-arabinose 1-dehydrogenase-like Zn-dependent alcohol dehydrogenase
MASTAGGPTFGKRPSGSARSSFVALAQTGALAPIPITRMPKSRANEALSLLNDSKVNGRIVLEPG